MRHLRAWAGVGVLCLLTMVSLSADTLILRDGRRIQGELVTIRDGVVEFDTNRGAFGRERVRLSQGDVAGIEFDTFDRRGQSWNDDRDRDRNGPSSRGDSRPTGLRERDVIVNANDPWRDTGVVLRAGQTVYFSATGRVRWGPGRQDGPGGERSSPRNDARPIPSRPAAALVGRIGDANDYFFIGDDTGPIRVRGGGRLFLGINDDFLQDNSGSFRVTVYY